jgi:hypothetical protein
MVEVTGLEIMHAFLKRAVITIIGIQKTRHFSGANKLSYPLFIKKILSNF